jgi:hypothetical protein
MRQPIHLTPISTGVFIVASETDSAVYYIVRHDTG